MEYQPDFDERDDVEKFSYNGVTIYFVPNGRDKFEFCTQCRTSEEKKIQEWMYNVNKKAVLMSDTPHVIRAAFEVGLKYPEAEVKKVIEAAKEWMGDSSPQKWEEMRAILNDKQYETDGLTYMSDVNNWVCVCASHYRPEENAQGKLCVKTRSMATEDRVFGFSIHAGLNELFEKSVLLGRDDEDVIVLAPYTDVVAQNGQPQEFFADGMNFIPDPDDGLVLPETAYIVRAKNNKGMLFEFGKNVATYKTDRYTQEEIDFILSLEPGAREKYETYMHPDIKEDEVVELFGGRKALIDWYNKNENDDSNQKETTAEAKEAFVRGLFDDERFALLSRILRNFVVKLSLKKMGYQYVEHDDKISESIAKTVSDNELCRDTSNQKGANSLVFELEKHGLALAKVVNTLESRDGEKIYKTLTSSGLPVCDMLISTVLSNEEGVKIPDFYASYRAKFRKLTGQKDLETDSIEKYNPNLERALVRFSVNAFERLHSVVSAIKEKPDFEGLRKRLRQYANQKKAALVASLQRG